DFVFHKEKNIFNYRLIVLPGGFSYGDYLRPGAIAKFSPIMESRYEFIEKLKQYVDLSKASVLEFGPAMGHMTEILSKVAKRVVAVDGSSEFLKIARKRLNEAKNVCFYESYFEDIKLDEKFDCILFHLVLEHVKEPIKLLRKIKYYCKKDGIVAISVPNANALSKQLAVKMGILNSIYELTENDRRHGHYHVFDWKKLETVVKKGGLEIIGRHGLFFKLFSDVQNIAILQNHIIGEEQIKGLWKLADELPELAGGIMIVAKVGEG
ncbi:MAG: methyltransferase domain-containing protein, partial [Chitinispirillaceae bacterium]|nr:methyltransferase domain-containing protein [Chitinispirillaceae bacterium]